MKICIDTNIYSAYKKGDSIVTDILEKTDEINIPSVVLGELYAGFYLGNRTKTNIAELEEFLAVPGISVIEIDAPIAEKYGYLIKTLKRQGTPIPTNDVWIAASALENSLKLMSYDTYFDAIPGIITVL
ncbi:MAG: type II toxin-antitoxin system VapC family toxin [Proteobacteria bacterium]|nr:type II toxin-antitoxin system VapC family toxin [Pseudomonadota bacterium]